MPDPDLAPRMASGQRDEKKTLPPPPALLIERDAIRFKTSQTLQPMTMIPENQLGHDRWSTYEAEYSKTGSMSSDSSFSPSEPREQYYGPERTSLGRQLGDPEKAMSGRGANITAADRDVASLAYADSNDDENETHVVQERHAVKILLFLAGPSVLLSGLNAIWALIGLCITILAQPVRLCSRRSTFGQQLTDLLGPALDLQLRCIYTPVPPRQDRDTIYRPWPLLTTHLLSPMLCLGIMFASWILAIYWASSMVVGDPAGMDKRDDGRETVLGLRRWWEAYLLRCVANN